MRRERPPDPRRTTRRVLNVLATGALLALVAVLWPAPLGGSVSYVMVNGQSMEPTMHLGDVVVLRRQSSYERGDVVAYRVPKGEVGEGAEVIHRIIGGDGRHGFVTRGDHNRSNDPWHPRTADVVGKRWVLLPRAGGVFGLLHSGLAVAAFAGMMGAFAALQLMTKRRARQVATDDRPVTAEPTVALVPAFDDPEPPRISWRAPAAEPTRPVPPIDIDLRLLDLVDPRRRAPVASASPWMRDALASGTAARD